MTVQASYSNVRANFSQYLNSVSDNNEIVVIDRRGKEPVAMIALSELDGLSETAHLLKSPQNASRLLNALTRSRKETTPPMTLDELKTEAGFE